MQLSGQQTIRKRIAPNKNEEEERERCGLLIKPVSLHNYSASLNYLQCFDAVGWAAGRASGL